MRRVSPEQQLNLRFNFITGKQLPTPNLTSSKREDGTASLRALQDEFREVSDLDQTEADLCQSLLRRVEQEVPGKPDPTTAEDHPHRKVSSFDGDLESGNLQTERRFPNGYSFSKDVIFKGGTAQVLETSDVGASLKTYTETEDGQLIVQSETFFADTLRQR